MQDYIFCTIIFFAGLYFLQVYIFCRKKGKDLKASRCTGKERRKGIQIGLRNSPLQDHHQRKNEKKQISKIF